MVLITKKTPIRQWRKIQGCCAEQYPMLKTSFHLSRLDVQAYDLRRTRLRPLVVDLEGHLFNEV